MKNSPPLTRVTAGTRESAELQSHKWKDNSGNHCPNSLPNSPRKCNPDLLSEAHCLWRQGDGASDGPGQQSCCELPAALTPPSCQRWPWTGAALHSASRDSGPWNIFSCWGICTGEHKPTHTLPQLPQSKATLEWSFYPNYLTKCIQFILLK